eukprot:scaffold3332_cov39-Prasinocladus_malaysianus.AAC.2
MDMTNECINFIYKRPAAFAQQILSRGQIANCTESSSSKRLEFTRPTPHTSGRPTTICKCVTWLSTSSAADCSDAHPYTYNALDGKFLSRLIV